MPFTPWGAGGSDPRRLAPADWTSGLRRTPGKAGAGSVIAGFALLTVVGHGPGRWRGLEDVAFATLEWVSWFNTARLLEPLGYLPPAEFEAQFHRTREANALAGALTYELSGKPGAIHSSQARGSAARCRAGTRAKPMSWFAPADMISAGGSAKTATSGFIVRNTSVAGRLSGSPMSG